jgi:hypothetical protein
LTGAAATGQGGRMSQWKEVEMQQFPMAADRIVGDGGGVTIYQRPDGSRYALDPRGRGHELCFGEGAMGPARFDARGIADGRWPGSRSSVAEAALAER